MPSPSIATTRPSALQRAHRGELVLRCRGGMHRCDAELLGKPPHAHRAVAREQAQLDATGAAARPPLPPHRGVAPLRNRSAAAVCRPARTTGRAHPRQRDRRHQAAAHRRTPPHPSRHARPSPSSAAMPAPGTSRTSCQCHRHGAGPRGQCARERMVRPRGERGCCLQQRRIAVVAIRRVRNALQPAPARLRLGQACRSCR